MLHSIECNALQPEKLTCLYSHTKWMPNVPAETIQQTHLHHKKITDNHTLTANKTTTLNIGTHVYTLRPYKITIIIVIFFLPVDANVMKANVMKVYITAMHFVFVFL